MEQPRRGRGGEDPKSVYLSIAIWADAKTREIHIAGEKHTGLLTTVNNKPGSERCHPHLYDKLKAILEQERKWPRGMQEREGRD